MQSPSASAIQQRRKKVCHDGRVDDAAGSSARDDSSPRDLHSALVATLYGRLIVGVVLTLFSFWIIAPNMPGSAVRTWTDGLWAPADSIGLNQDWSVFSPNPRDQSLDVRARIEFTDGRVEFWDVPEFDPFIGAYRQYRWHKWQERVRLDDTSNLWAPTAGWIAEQYTTDGVGPERVVLIRRWITHQPLTIDGAIFDEGWNEYEFYSWEPTP
jgi:hypothetical protein